MDSKLRDMLTVDDIPPPRNLNFEQYGMLKLKSVVPGHGEEDEYCFYCSGQHLHASVVEDECRYRYDLPPMTDKEYLEWWRRYETPFADRQMSEEDFHGT